MKEFVLTAALVFSAIYLWSKIVAPSPKKVGGGSGRESPVDTGEFAGPNIDPKTGAYTEYDNTTGAVAYSTQPVGLQ